MERGLIGKILGRVESAGLRVARLKLVALEPAEARRFYRVHEGRPFLDGLVEYIVLRTGVRSVVLEGEGAIARLREIGRRDRPGRRRPPARSGAIWASTCAATRCTRPTGRRPAAEEIAFFGLTLRRDEGA